MATPKIIADFETQLATALAVGGTSFTLASATDDDGVALPTGKYYFTIENGTSQKEYVVGTLTGTSVASVSNVSRQGTETSGVVKAHRVGASVIMTDFLTYKNYIDETTVAGAADADTNTKGVVEGATLAEVRARTATGGTGAALALTPDVCDDLPTEDEKAAMTGVNTAPDASNPFVTLDDLSDDTIKPPQVVTFTSSGTWTKDAGLKYIIIEGVGGGGGGEASGSSNGDIGSGGSGGGYFRKLILASDLSATETVTIGAGGAGGSGSDVDGSAGGNTAFGPHATGGAGLGGTGDGSSALLVSGGTATGGDINIQGGSCGTASGAARGGDSYFGYGGIPVSNGSSSGTGYGSGGSGGYCLSGSTSRSGGSGKAGYVIVTEYYS